MRKDGTVSYQGQRFEVSYTLSGRSVRVVVDPHAGQVIGVEDDNSESLGAATPLDAVANAHRQRRRPEPGAPASPAGARAGDATGENAVELAYRQYHGHDGEEN